MEHFADGEYTIDLVINSLRHIDTRLVGHGERVAYICGKMLRVIPDGNNLNRDTLLPLALLHDIGAYKTEDIDKMVEFETYDVLRHAVYGYIFLKNRSAFGDEAEAVLYHHTPYNILKDKNTLYKRQASLISLCDRVDILLANGITDFIENIEKKSGTLFNPEFVGLLSECEKRFSMSKNIIDGSWKAEFDREKQSVSFSLNEVAELVKMLVYAIDFRSEQTVSHTSGVVAYSKEIGKLAGLSEAELSDLVYAAFLHDIGKIAMPVSILEKPGKLTENEMVIMREHIIHSEKILRGVVPDVIADIAVRHHERCDGSGYPDGLFEKDMTLSQKILMVADVLTALTERRSYKNAFSKDTTLDIINDLLSKGRFPADVCKILFDNYDNIVTTAGYSIEKARVDYSDLKHEYDSVLINLE